jgi:Protein of unknown function (DUF2723)
VGGVALVVYVLTLYRTLPGGDSGELISAVASGGVLHPPGYPLYSLLGAAFIHLPIGSLAFRMNLLSATCDAAAATVLTLAVSRGTRSRAGGVLSGALFAFGAGVWRYAIAAEVFALNNLAITLLLWVAVAYDDTRDFRYALVGALVLGLGLCNHQTILFTGIPLIAWAVWKSEGVLVRPRALGRLTLAGTVGLLPYLYLPIAGARRALVTWGAADSWSGFWIHVLRREFGTFQLAPSGATAVATDIARAWGEHTIEQVGWVGVAVAAIGAGVAFAAGRKRRRGLGLVLWVPPFVSVGVMMAGANMSVKDPIFGELVARFWQEPDIYVCGFLGVAFASLTSRLPPWAPALLAATLSLLQLGTNYRSMDRHASHLVEDYGAEMVRAAPPGALVVARGDLITNVLRYVLLSRHERPDLRVVDHERMGASWGVALYAARYPDVVFPGSRYSASGEDGFTLKQLLDANRARPRVMCGGMAPEDSAALGSYGLWSLGFCDEIDAARPPSVPDGWFARSEEAMPRVDFTDQAHERGTWEGIVWEDYWAARRRRAAHLMRVATSDPLQHGYVATVVDILSREVNENPDAPVNVYKNLAVALEDEGVTTPAQATRLARVWEAYLAVAPRGDPQLGAIREKVARLLSVAGAGAR